MDALTISAASGLRARMDSLEMLANNVANASTPGYKADREFYSLYFAPEAAGPLLPGSDGVPDKLPVVERPWTDFSQGVVRPTDNPLDLALSGKGFFAVNGPSGPLYTRNGNFRISAAGLLVNTEGLPVRGVGASTLQTQSSKPIEVKTDGTVLQDGQVLGQLEVVDFQNSSDLMKQGNNYFRRVDPATVPKPATDTEIQQGRIEGSNVGSAEAAVKLVGVMRQFEMLQKAIALGGEMNRRAVEEVARVAS